MYNYDKCQYCGAGRITLPTGYWQFACSCNELSDVERRIKMNKEDVKRRLKAIEDEAEKLRKIIKEYEAVALKHTTFGITDANLPFIKLGNDIMWLDKHNAQTSKLSPDSPCFREGALGNLLDMMKDWDKPFRGYNKEAHASGIDIVDDKYIRLYACTGGTCTKKGYGITMSIVQAAAYRNAIGHAIAHIKRQNA